VWYYTDQPAETGSDRSRTAVTSQFWKFWWNEAYRNEVSRLFESFPVLLTVSRDRQIAQLRFVPSRMKTCLTRDTNTAERPILNIFLKYPRRPSI
jgi:hypothetical protein